MRKFLVRCFFALGFLVLLLALVAGFVVWRIRASLPRLDGRQPVRGLTAEVRVTRDALGVPEITGTNRLDVSRALGFVHAQERYFQMDLLRRRGAGELAELIGPALIDHDEDVRRHQLRASAREGVRQLPPKHRALLDAYVEGVNAGLAALAAAPPEYLLLRTDPKPWLPEDSLLVGYAMFFTLQDPAAAHEQAPPKQANSLPAEVRSFFRPNGSDWDAALDDTTFPSAPIPGPDLIDFSKIPSPIRSADSPSAPSRQRPEGVARLLRSPFVADAALAEFESEPVPGSNSWGVDGASSITGSAIIANDMHLDLGLPNIWFRACLRWHDETGNPRLMVGASLPGVPALIIGSNGRIAWGFTNATLDSTDLVRIEVDRADATRYRTAKGWKTFEKIVETISVRGESTRIMTFEKTIWGPVLPSKNRDELFAIRWIAHDPGAINLGLLDLESASSVDEALTLAPNCHIPMQNFLVGDRSGKLAWTLIGLLPNRVGFDGKAPTSWAGGTHFWKPSHDANQRPRWIAESGQRLWTANNRILGSPEYLGLGGFLTDAGARGRQIRDDLRALPAKTDEAGLLTIHRDDRALLLERWQRLLLEVLNQPAPAAHAQAWAEAQKAVAQWGGRASVDSVGYRLVRAFRLHALARVYAPVQKWDPHGLHGFDYQSERAERPFWALAEAQSRHLLDPKFESYPALYREAMEAVLADLASQKLSVAEATWGARNRSRIQHPISRAVPKLAPYLDMASVPLPGDDRMPRVQGQSFGASERMIVSPGHEERGIFHMPGGQSGHFLSPYYRAGHEAWVQVEPTPLLPGTTQHTLVLQPGTAK